MTEAEKWNAEPSEMEFSNKEANFILQMANAQWNEAVRKLNKHERGSQLIGNSTEAGKYLLGDIERENIMYERDMALVLIQKLSKKY